MGVPNKLLLPRSPVVSRWSAAPHDCLAAIDPMRRVTVVLGHEADEVRAALTGLAC
jgi:hypothetical protein